MEAQRELTFGEKAVGLTFNPSGNKKVQDIKEKMASVIDLVYTPTINDDKFADELENTAIQQLILAQMAAVKSATWSL